MNFARALAAAVLVALALSGCVRLDLQTTLTDHGTANGALVVAMADDAAGMLGDPADVWAEYKDQAVGDVPDSVTEEPYAEDGYTGSRYLFEDEPVATLAAISGGDLEVVREGDEYVVSGVLDLSRRIEGIENAPEDVLGSVEATITLTFPGPVTEANGEIDGSTVTWHPDAERATELSARGPATAAGVGPGATGEPSARATAEAAPTAVPEEADGIISAWGTPITLATLLVVVVGGLVAYMVSRRQRTTADHAQA